jgi:Leucine-rich repeat (LRR) protein
MMKNKIIPVLILIFSVSCFYSQSLIFKDKNLEKAVIENSDLNKDGKINQFEADRIENLFLVNKGITNTEDLAYFKNAKMIVLDDNSILNLSLKNMDHLQLFSCTGCKISNFKAENLKNLASLYLDNNQIENISLKTTPRIDQLTVSLNKIKTIDVSSLKYLKKLNLEHNLIQKLDISKNMNLETLNVMKNPLKETDIKKGAVNVTIFGFQQQ